MKLLKQLPKKKKVLMNHIGIETYYIGMFGKFKTVVTKREMGSLGVDPQYLQPTMDIKNGLLEELLW